ncbi:MAG: HAD family hydrolase [Alphaproteobacteria bacterium]|nr:HAD family hydrolase [Alphaproteobacteria bacterium]MDE2337361.1 HAD family hydrolase [Alphaproteobacteria bacterium]
MIKAIFLDMDDTLIVNTVLYEEAAAVMSGYLCHYGVPLAEARRMLAKTDRDLFKTQGYSRERYPDVFEKVLRHYVPKAGDDKIETVRRFAEDVFSTVAKVKPGTIEAVELLTAKFPVYIVTQGDKEVQENRVAHLPFRKKLTGVFVVEKKRTDVFSGIVDGLGYSPREAVMIGDSLKSDVVPSVAAGMHAIWIEAHNWAVESTTEVPSERMYKFSSLLEAARYLTNYKPPSELTVLRSRIRAHIGKKIFKRKAA